MAGIDRDELPVGLYVARVDLSEAHLLGVASKIRAQCKVLRDSLAGRISLLYPSKGAIRCDDQVLKRFGNSPLGRRLAYYVMFYFVAASRAKSAHYIYLRYQGASPILLWMLWTVRRRRPGTVIVVEIPTFPYQAEATGLRAKLMLLNDLIWRKRVFRHVDRVVTFSHAAMIFGVPTIQTENGVDVDALPLLPAPPSDGPFRLVGVANVSYWHGYDRVIVGLRNYYAASGGREVHFDVVGVGAELKSMMDLAKKEGVDHLVHFHGALSGAALADLIAQCHVGISCIGLHRKSSDTTDLKSREYCARGLPFVMGYSDRDFAGALPFVFQAPHDDSPIDIAGTVKFHARLLGEHPDYRSQMRTFARQRLSWLAKMRPVLEFMQEMYPRRRCQ